MSILTIIDIARKTVPTFICITIIFEFILKLSSSNAIKNTSTNIDYTITGTRDFSGIEMINGAIGDNIMMRILDDASGTYSGYPNATLNQYGTNWFVRENFVKNLPYPARVYTGMIVRFVYTNANVSTDRTIYFNLDLHKVV